MDDKDIIPKIVSTLDASYIQNMADSKNPPKAVFLGNFQSMSLTDQRHWCKANNWFYAEHIAMCSLDDEQVTGLLHLWKTITLKTKLIVIGNAYKFSDIEYLLNRNTPKRAEKGMPLLRVGVTTIMESEIHKYNPDYLNIDNNTSWCFKLKP
ncbi:hypothetical protein [Bathymodiolus septemdierum thioautotrophic gill symbiont]|uniref:Uncharacterized protein n=1 Tax=endosymbiont of Bathymodiolus septemdierum str. Myojin knoll TaxID=1303921 RepID=A0A0P0URC3_9GAMM|nr:hypothetical protein [Bathymodiolus septemdierum thioautotrophic gill symbiont]BAS67605.1 hypothetical protein BSEPE_0598 [endosymbiont of Bathymodiolus septemdierum str. Myojin knoll]